ncbi:MAG: bacillithiol biosynthesis cysteine-adding enzyme BshC [Candidatus Binatia bacterium]
MTRTHRSTELRAFAPAWLAGERDARELLPAGFESREARANAATTAATRRCAPSLHEVLVAQHRELPASTARERHLELLATGGAAVVVTGQQVGLFTGPAFTLYKAAGVVAAARRLAEESGVPCVPLFWLQTEDHDWPEIDHCVVHAGNEARRITVAGSDVSARVSVASRNFDSGIETALTSLEDALATHAHGGDVVTLLRRHYRSGVSPASALRGVLAELFTDDGLLFLDPRTPEVGVLTRPLLERSLVEADSLAATLERRAELIEAVGLAVQVPVRHGAPLCFFHPDGAPGPRYRLESRGDVWRLSDSDREVGRDEALRIVGEDPLRVSSSALLRPLIQDSLLPTAMYLGGPGEIAYFAQLAPLYEALDVAMPLVAPRPSFCVTGAGDRRRLEALGIGFADVCGAREDVLARLTRSHDGDVFPPDDVEDALTSAFMARLAEFAAHALPLDSTLARPIERARESVAQSVARLADKYRRSVLYRDTVLIERLDRVRAALAPNGVAQERCYGFASLAAEHGIIDLLTAIRRTLEPFDARTREIEL